MTWSNYGCWRDTISIRCCVCRRWCYCVFVTLSFNCERSKIIGENLYCRIFGWCWVLIFVDTIWAFACRYRYLWSILEWNEIFTGQISILWFIETSIGWTLLNVVQCGRSGWTWRRGSFSSSAMTIRCCHSRLHWSGPLSGARDMIYIVNSTVLRPSLLPSFWQWTLSLFGGRQCRDFFFMRSPHLTRWSDDGQRISSATNCIAGQQWEDYLTFYWCLVVRRRFS